MKRVAALLAVFVLVIACNKPTVEEKQPEAAEKKVPYEKEIRDWQANRSTRLQAEDSWLSLVGLFWLNEGENRFGSDKDANNIVMPAKAPPSMGTLTLADGKVTMTPASPMTIEGAPVEGPVQLIADTQPNGPTVVKSGSMQFQIIERAGRYGVRVKDPESEARANFKGLEYFPVDPKWRVEARLEPYDPPKEIPITNIVGFTTDEISPGALVFTLGGKEYRIDPIVEKGSEDYFLIFKDETSRDATYQAGRYLYAKPAGKDGKVIIDFNKAYNPPCAFTDFATCPLPPLQNRLPVRIEAGEKRYAGAHG